MPKGKATDTSKQLRRNAVIYTRVSTKEQADTNQSLETQKKYCLQYALKHDLNVLDFFGGTYASVKTDERNEFNRMIRFVKNQKDVDKKRLSEVLRNPFYCGYLSHSLLDGQVVKGKHDGLISEELFLKANDILKRNTTGYKQESKNLNIPLKNFVRCAECDTPFTGYIVKTKNLYYYKCNRIGCKCNRSAKTLHGLFTGLLKTYELNPAYLAPLKEQFLYLCETLAESGKSNSDNLKKNLGHLEAKFEKLEERFAFGEVDREIFEKIGGKLKQEIQSIKDELAKSGFQLSNPSMLIDQSLEIISNLSEFWASGDYEHKHKLQELLFSGGILFDKQIDNYRTPNVNSILSLTRSLSDSIGENKNGQIRNLSDLPGLVGWSGANIELPSQ